jgi:rhodanese-related sulfurtransferase
MMKRRRLGDNMRRRIALSGIAFVVLALLVAACGSATEPGDAAATEDGFAKNADSYTDITVEQLAEMMPDKDFTLVNVHIPYEGEIPETDLFIPFDEVAENVNQLPDKDAPIVLYCRSGSMSTTAAKTLVDLGYTNILEVDGGFNAWKSAGNELLDEGR